MANIFNLKIKERSNMKIGKIASSAEYRMDKQFQNFRIFLENSKNF